MDFDKAEKYIDETDIRKLYVAIGEGSTPYNPAKHDFLKLKINEVISNRVIAALNSLEKTIGTNSDASNKLSNRVFCLNVVIAFAAVVAIIPTVSSLLSKIF